MMQVNLLLSSSMMEETEVEAEDISKGSYTIYLHDNDLNYRTHSGYKNRTLIYGQFKGIIDE